MIRLAFVLAAALALGTAASAQPTPLRTAVFAEAWGPTGAYTLGVARDMARLGASSVVGVRVGASHDPNQIAGVDGSRSVLLAGVAGVVPVARLGRVGLALDGEVGGALARRSGVLLTHGESGTWIAVPYGSAAVRAGLGRAHLRVGAALTDLTLVHVQPLVGVGVAL
ncbi:hypothetical protein [Rubrivirga sp. IMCC45206]|uniref:hypothetical protein n=1 Tax=Rubrivirga sp. IMCC45206 TaxID=3391614 RepID=UPI00399000CD